MRRLNRLRRAERIDEANALAQRIGKYIVNRNKTRLSRINRKTCAKDLWKAVRQLTSRRQNSEAADGIIAESFYTQGSPLTRTTSQHSANFQLTTQIMSEIIASEWQLFNICLLYTSPSPRDGLLSRMPSSA